MRFTLLACVCVVALSAASHSADPAAENKLLGTWKLISAKYGGKEAARGEGVTHLKHVTATQFNWVIYDKDGVLQASLGGAYTIKKDAYEETPAYGTESLVKQLKGKAQSFTWAIEDGKWKHNGKLSNGVTVEEVWERVDAKK